LPAECVPDFLFPLVSVLLRKDAEAAEPNTFCSTSTDSPTALNGSRNALFFLCWIAPTLQHDNITITQATTADSAARRCQTTLLRTRLPESLGGRGAATLQDATDEGRPGDKPGIPTRVRAADGKHSAVAGHEGVGSAGGHRGVFDGTGVDIGASEARGVGRYGTKCFG
jgi:hypothetical protein